MKKFEKIAGAFIILALIMKFIGIPGSGLLAVWSFSSLSILYYLGFALFNDIMLKDIFKSGAYTYTNAKRIFGSVVLGFSLSAIVMGMLFKIQLWEGGNTQLTAGLLMTGVIFLVSGYMFSRGRDEFYTPLIKRIAIVGGFGLFLLLTPDSALVDIYYRDNPEFAELLKQSMANPENDEIRIQLDSIRKEMDKQ